MRTLVAAGGGAGGGSVGSSGEDGGEANVVAYGRSRGDGNPVFVGVPEPGALPFPGPVPLPQPALGLAAVGAFGGAGADFLSLFLPPITPPAGDGGNARSTSVGIAEGDSRVDVFDFAGGGDGGFQVGI